MKNKEAEAKGIKSTKKAAVAVQTRGRTFQGTVIKKFPGRIVVEFERTVRVPKYERFARKKTKLHARIPAGMEVEAGDYVKVRECRPLSKIIHFALIEVLKQAEKKK